MLAKKDGHPTASIVATPISDNCDGPLSKMVYHWKILL
jgi:hypothetical protein